MGCVNSLFLKVGAKMVKRFKWIFIIIGILLLSGIFFGSLMTFGRFREEQPAEYSIKYIGVLDEQEADIPSVLWRKGGAYPKGYDSGKETSVDDLLGKMTLCEWEDGSTMYVGSPVSDTNPYKDYSFYGWYLDKKCTIPFDGTISENTVGDIRLYAKISVGYWTDCY